MGAVYFQPIDMEPASSGLKAADASFHLEADIHASQEGTDYGYGKGDFVPDLTVNYTIIDKSTGKEVEGGKATSGTFMQMTPPTARTTAPTSSSTRLAPTSSSSPSSPRPPRLDAARRPGDRCEEPPVLDRANRGHLRQLGLHPASVVTA